MAWCENENCRKEGLRKADVEFDDTTRKVLCHGCMTLVHPGWVPPSEYVDVSGNVPHVEVMNKAPEPQLGFMIQVTDHGGLRAQVSYGGLRLALHAPPEDIKGLLGV